MQVRKLHDWQVGIPQAISIQKNLAKQVSMTGKLDEPCFIAGVDISVNRVGEMAAGAVVILNYPELKLMEVQVVRGKPDMPYVPGLLSFREAPLILAACEKLTLTPDLILVDGQGIAHPRRFGLASHLGLLLDIPAIGCAKSRLCGSHDAPDIEAGSYAEIVDSGEIIGAALRTKHGVNPLYVSVGNKVDLQTAIFWVMQCCRGYRLPEPARFAHLAAGGNLKQEAPGIQAEYICS